MKACIIVFARIGFLFVLLGAWNNAFAQFRLDIRKLAGGQEFQETGAGGELESVDLELRLAMGGRIVRQWENSRKTYRRQLGEVLEARQQNERLTAAEHAKLWLAGVGDIEKFMQAQEEAEEVRVIQNNRVIIIQGNNIRVGEQRGPLFGAGSMLALVSKRLTHDDPEILGHRRQVASAAEELLLTDLEGVMPLTSKQHKAVLELLEKHRPISAYAHFRKHYVEAMKCLLDNSQELRTEFNQQQLKSFEGIVGNAQNALGKLPVPNL